MAQHASRNMDVLVRRATQCSFSSAFHIDANAATKRTINRVYLFMIVPAVGLCGGVGLYRIDQHGLRLGEGRKG